MPRGKKKYKDMLNIIMKSVPQLSDEEMALLRRHGALEEELSNETLVAMALLEKALAGNIAAIEYIDKRLGLHPETILKERKLILTEKEAAGEDKDKSREELKEIFKSAGDEDAVEPGSEGADGEEASEDDYS